MEEDASLARLASLAGILPSYCDAWGQERRVPTATKIALLTAMGLAAGTPVEIEASIRRLDEAPWRQPLPPVVVLRRAKGGRIELPLTLPAETATAGPIAWRFERESGEVREGQLRFADLLLAGARALDGQPVERRLFSPPFSVPLGYHSFALRLGNGEATLPVIVVPRRCHLPPAKPGDRWWGLTLQLYGLRSERNWGIGDLADLAKLGSIAGKLGAAALGLNPLHALFPETPSYVSPYSPSDRRFLNGLYLAVEEIADLWESEEAQRLLQEPALQRQLAALRSEPLVDHGGVAAAKRPLLEQAYRSFRERHLQGADGMSDRGAAFRRFQAAKGEALARLGVFQALAEQLQAGAWKTWPAGYRDPASAEVRAFAEAHRERVEFFQYLQWQADLQLAAAARAGKEAGLALGLYHDLALAPDANGAEAWSDQRLLASGMKLGAPPDEWSQRGQDWGMPPYNPLALREAGYAPFVTVLRANMAHAGALRIDHVIGFERLFWIPEGSGAAEGGYVRYPTDDLLGIVALESARQKCVVIGEDLGTVPEGFSDRLRSAAMLSYRLLYFTRDAEGGYLVPRRYPATAAVAVTTHDLATLAGFWRGRDLEVRKALGLFPSEAAQATAFDDRVRDRRLLLQALQGESLLPADVRDDNTDLSCGLPEAVYRFLGRTPSRLLLVGLEDLTGEVEQANVPGTIDEHPNWRRKLPMALEALARDPQVAAFAAAVRAERRRGTGRS